MTSSEGFQRKETPKGVDETHPRMTELGCQTFMPIQTLDLLRVKLRFVSNTFWTKIPKSSHGQFLVVCPFFQRSLATRKTCSS